MLNPALYDQLMKVIFRLSEMAHNLAELGDDDGGNYNFLCSWWTKECAERDNELDLLQKLIRDFTMGTP